MRSSTGNAAEQLEGRGRDWKGLVGCSRACASEWLCLIRFLSSALGGLRQVRHDFDLYGEGVDVEVHANSWGEAVRV